MKQYAWILTQISLIIIILVSCTSKAQVELGQAANGSISLQWQSSADLSYIMMNYFEDIDLVLDIPTQSGDLPSAFEEAVSFLAPYVQALSLSRNGNRINLQFRIDDLERFNQRFTADGFGLVSFSSPIAQQATYTLKLAVTQTELNRMYETMPTLPRVPSKWDRSSKRTYVQQLANIFGSTKNERARLEQELHDATLTISLNLPKEFTHLQVRTESTSHHSSAQTAHITVNMIDFITGNSWIELQWQGRA